MSAQPEAASQPRVDEQQRQVELSLESLTTRYREIKTVFRAIFVNTVITRSFTTTIVLKNATDGRDTNGLNYHLLSASILTASQASFQNEFEKFAQMITSMILLLTQLDADDGYSSGSVIENTFASQVTENTAVNPVLMGPLLRSNVLLGTLNAIRLEFMTMFRLIGSVMQAVQEQAGRNRVSVQNLLDASVKVAGTMEILANRKTPDFTDSRFGLILNEQSLPDVSLTEIIAGSFDYLTPQIVAAEMIHMVTILTTKTKQVLRGGIQRTEVDRTPQYSTDWYKLVSKFDGTRAAVQSANPMLDVATKMETYAATMQILEFDPLNRLFNVVDPVRRNAESLLVAALQDLGDQLLLRKVDKLTPFFLPGLVAVSVRWTLGPYESVSNDIHLNDVVKAYDKMLSKLVTKHRRTNDPEGWVAVAAHRVAIADWLQTTTNTSRYNNRVPENNFASALQRVLGVRPKLEQPERISVVSHHRAMVGILNNVAFLRKDIGPLQEICVRLVNVVLDTRYERLQFNTSDWLRQRVLQIVTPQGDRISYARLKPAVRLDPFAIESNVPATGVTVQNIQLDPFSLYQEFANGARMALRTQTQPAGPSVIARYQEQLRLAREQKQRETQDVTRVQQELQDALAREQQLTTRIQQLQQENEQAALQVAALEVQVQDLEGVIQQRVTDLQTQDQTIGTIVQQRNEAQRQLDASLEDATQKQQELERAREELKRQQELIREFRAEVDRLENLLDESRQDIAFITQQLEQSQESQQQLAEQRDDNQLRINNLEDQLSQTQSRVEEQQTQADALQDVLDEKTAEVNQLQAQRDALVEELLQLESQQASEEERQVVSRQIQLLEAQLTESQQERQRLQSELSTAQRLAQTLKDELLLQQEEEQRLRDQLERVSETLEQQKATAARLQASLDEQQQQQQETKAQLQAERERLLETQQDLDKADEELAETIVELDEQRDRNNALEKQVEELKQNLQQATAQVDEETRVQLQELEQIVSERDQAQKALQQSKTRARAFKNRASSVQRQQTRLRELLTEKNSQLQRETQERQAAEARVQELEETIRELQAGQPVGSSSSIGINLIGITDNNERVRTYFETLERLGNLVYTFNNVVVEGWMTTTVLSAANQFDKALEDYFLTGNARGLDVAIQMLRTSIGEDTSINQQILDRLAIVDSLCGDPSPLYILP